MSHDRATFKALDLFPKTPIRRWKGGAKPPSMKKYFRLPQQQVAKRLKVKGGGVMGHSLSFNHHSSLNVSSDLWIKSKSKGFHVNVYIRKQKLSSLISA